MTLQEIYNKLYMNNKIKTRPLHIEYCINRKYRWTLEGKLPGGEFEPIFVKYNNSIERHKFLSTYENEISPNKWIVLNFKEPFNITMFESKEFCNTIVGPSICSDTGEIPQSETLYLTLYDGCGFELEKWQIENAYFKNLTIEEWDETLSEDKINMDIYYEKISYKTNKLISYNYNPYNYNPATLNKNL